MATFDAAIKLALKHEGGLVDDEDDKGGITNYGISLGYALLSNDLKLFDINRDNKVDADDIREITQEEAKEIYKKEWWDKYKYFLIDDQDIANKVLDISINIGPKSTHKHLQKATNLLYPSNSQLKIDGILGPKTFGAVNKACSHQLLKHFVELICDYYRNICAKNVPLRKFLRGWLNRAKGF